MRAETSQGNIFAKKRFRANPADAKASISPNTQVTFIDERVTSFLMLTNIESSRLERIHEGNLFGGQPLNTDNAPAYPRLM
ncbi:hypothetical protein CEE69_08195 [Rhodopirellula bahusiensis]|uniref:Uncharacterized protein n=1 Tax=Rhodopirellula bahusiensis TaxID=2014065 RepID=A0A2G1W9U5_9BACT|nr:hypothetical protein CEE69_08195 [Rhodopirellula bahusiensis]